MKSDNLRALPSGTKISDYQIQSVLGFGGFGITYLALDTTLDLRVAIKEYFPREFAVRAHSTQVKPAGSHEDRDTFKWGLERFLQEARVLARFKHPNIVSVTRFFEENGTAYLVMDYCEGRPLDQIFEQEGKLSHAQLCSIIPPLLDALERVHRASLLHRDIKPANIFLREDDSPVLLDFGAARQELVGHSRSVTSLVTANYSSIEQYSTHGKQGPWSDIYSLGATFYRAVTGVKLQDAPDRILDDHVQPVMLLENGRYPTPLLQAIDAAIKVRPEDRPQSVSEWRALFGSSLDHKNKSNNDSAPVMLSDIKEFPNANFKPNKFHNRGFLLGIGFVILSAGALTLSYGTKNAPPERKEATPVPVPSTPSRAENSKTEDKDKPQSQSGVSSNTPERTPATAELTKCVGNDHTRWDACIGSKTNDGTKYTGEFRKGVESGRGEAVWQSGLRYVGEFRNGNVNGKGKFFFANGDSQEGTFKDGKANGKTIYRWKNGNSFEGIYVDDVREGRGIARFADGEVHESVYKNGKQTNPVTVTLANGDTYIGDINFDTSRWEGRGTYRFKDGRRYVGDFKDGRRNGSGIEYDTAGVIVRSGQWRNGDFAGTLTQTTSGFSTSAASPTGTAVYATPTASITPKASDSEKLRLCENEAAAVRKTLPKKTDLLTTTTGIFCIQTMRGAMVVYRADYEGRIAAPDQPEMYKKMFEETKKRWCNSSNLRPYLKQLDVEYRFYDDSRALGLVVTIGEKDCR